MILYHFPTSPFARRVRIAMAQKGVVAELRDARNDPAHRAESNRLNPMHTTPVLVDGSNVLTQTSTILHHLDVHHPTPRLFPSDERSIATAEWIAAADNVITTLVDLGLRYAGVHDAPRFPAVREELGGRAQRTLEALATSIADSKYWQAGEHAVFTLVVWISSLPARAAVYPPAVKMLEVGLQLPPALVAWADQHRERPEVLAL
jgi:glutathione S-transferase